MRAGAECYQCNAKKWIERMTLLVSVAAVAVDCPSFDWLHLITMMMMTTKKGESFFYRSIFLIALSHRFELGFSNPKNAYTNE